MPLSIIDRCRIALVAVALATAFPGCTQCRNLLGWGPPVPAQCALPDDANAQQIVLYLNDNTHKLRGWRTTRAKISARGNILVPKLDATVVVESPRNFRLVATNVTGGHEVDLGSNIEQFWFWVRRNEDKQVVVASHDLDPERMRRFPFPFQPDWIMETMGVIAIDPEEDFVLKPGAAGSHVATLISNRTSPQGHPVRKVTVVDLRQGVIREHALLDARNQPIARAVLSQHARDKTSDAMIPTKIELDWPQAQLALTMTLSEVEVNPAHYSQNTWKLPPFPGYEIYDLNR
ncbi:MAG: hypothetical protein HY290_19065 [Planctomycetia bacterium]|nr:hypothetical protein [Planctomycetia bacterium]